MKFYDYLNTKPTTLHLTVFLVDIDGNRLDTLFNDECVCDISDSLTAYEKRNIDFVTEYTDYNGWTIAEVI